MQADVHGREAGGWRPRRQRAQGAGALQGVAEAGRQPQRVPPLQGVATAAVTVAAVAAGARVQHLVLGVACGSDKA